MEKKIDNILFANTKDGRRLTYRVLFTHHSDRFNKDYAVFYNEDDENDLLLFSYDENVTLSKPETNEEYEELNEVLQAYDREQAEKKDNNEE